MPGDKNYAHYRQTVQLRALSIIIPDEWIRRQDNVDLNAPHTGTGPAAAASDPAHTHFSGPVMTPTPGNHYGVHNDNSISNTDPHGAHTPAHSNSCGTVPHLGAHLAEAITIAEGNPAYLPHAPHSLNMNKLRFTARSVKVIARLQRARYVAVYVACEFGLVLISWCVNGVLPILRLLIDRLRCEPV
jgi:hypothetical protein